MASDGRVDPATTTEDLLTRQQRVARSVLVVDDDAAVLGVISRILRRAGGEVTTASSGRDALQLIAAGRVNPGILLTDIDMPEMTGIELAARVAAMRPGTRIVMMTGDPASADRARQHVGMIEAVLLKPVTIEELVEAMRWP